MSVIGNLARGFERPAPGRQWPSPRSSLERYAVNLHADKGTLKVEGETAVFHAQLDDGQGGCRVSTGERHFCAGCARGPVLAPGISFPVALGLIRVG